MIIYVLFALLGGIIGGILLATRSQKAEGVTYGALDKAGFVTNIILIPIYACISPVCMFIGIISEPYDESIISFLIGIIVALIIASMPLFAGLGLGFSVALRKKGKSKLSFAVQFAGIVGAILTFLLYVVCVDIFISSLN